MKILHITALAFRGGCEKNCFHFCAATPSFNNEIIVLDKEGPMSSAWTAQGVHLTHLDILKLDIFSFGRKLKAFLKKKEYDMAICWSTVRLPLQLNAVRNSVNEVRVYLGNPLTPEYNTAKDIFLSIFFNAPKTIRLMACSAYVAKSHERNSYFNKFPISVSLNPVAIPSSQIARNKYPTPFKLGMVARLDPIKDHVTAILGFKEVLKRNPLAELHLVGDGSLRQTLEQLTERERISDKVYFHGDVDDVYHHLNQWDVFIYATTPNEGLGSVVEEAMANGLPCVLCDLPMLRELAPEDGLVRWFPAGNIQALATQVNLLIDDPDSRMALGKAAFEYARHHFGAQRFINDYLN